MNPQQELTVVVTGSTGKQGGAVARGLLERGHKVRAVTRDPNSSKAKSLANAGATLVAASLEDTAAITKALAIYAATLPPTRTLAQVAVADIGAVAVRVLEDAGRFTGKRFDLASDELTGTDVVAILSRVTGRPFSYYQVPLDVIRQRMGEDGARMYEWLDRVGYTVDRAALHREFPDVAFHDFESWAKTQDWNALLQSA